LTGALKIVVTVKQVPDPNSTLTLEADNTLSREKEVVLDPGDECGVEEGLQLKEAHGGEVILVSMGPERAKDAIRKGLSMGADRGILITDPQLAGADALITALAVSRDTGVVADSVAAALRARLRHLHGNDPR